jgi:hypothetical protein
MKKITKLMLTLALLLVGVTGANAAETTIYTMDYSTATSFNFYNGAPSDVSVGIENGMLVIVNGKKQANNYDLQLHIGAGFQTVQGNDYKVKIEYKATIDHDLSGDERVWIAFGDWSNRETNYWVPLTENDDFQTLTLEFHGGNEHPGFQYDSSNAFVMWQGGDVVGTIYIKKVEVIEIVTTPPVDPVWTTIIDNDARCFRSKEYPDGNVLPVKINDNGEFVVNAPAKVSDTWDSQFWIRLPQTLAAGKKFKVSFDYKASAAVKAETQSHNEPGQYIHWACAGDVNFTTEWQTFNTTVKVDAACDGGDNQGGFKNDFRTIAFNLSQTDAVDFYFRNIKVEIDENDVTEPDYPADLYIVAGTEDLCGDGVSWDPRSMDNAMTLNSKTGLYVKTFENVAINSESYPKFRVVKNCSWSTAWPENDWVINTGTSGLFNITITYDPTNNEIAVDTEEIYTMTVAGNNTTLFGMAWDPTNTNNDLTKNEDGTFSITYEGKVLEEGQIIQFKVVKNHSWDVAYPEEDYQLNIPRSSNYDVTITFNPENKEVVATIKDNAVVSSYYLVGGEKDAAWTVGDVLTKDEDVYSIEIPYSSEYSFAIAPNTALNDLKNKVVNWNIVIRPVETTSVDFENVSGQVSTTDNSQNWTMVEKGNGEQKEFNALFSYDSKESTWTITASTTTTIGETGYATYSNAKPYTVEGATANFVTIPNRYAVLVPQDADAILPAMTGAGKNAGVILSGAAGEVIINAVAKGAVATATGIDENLLAGSGNYSYGISTQFADNDPYTAYIFAQPEGKELGFYIADLNAGADLPAHKAFLAVPKGADAREFIGFEPGETTSIADNNRVTITNNGEVYNLNGQRVAQPTKGLYIVNGRKFVVK